MISPTECPVVVLGGNHHVTNVETQVAQRIISLLGWGDRKWRKGALVEKGFAGASVKVSTNIGAKETGVQEKGKGAPDAAGGNRSVKYAHLSNEKRRRAGSEWRRSAGMCKLGNEGCLRIGRLYRVT